MLLDLKNIEHSASVNYRAVGSKQAPSILEREEEALSWGREVGRNSCGFFKAVDWTEHGWWDVHASIWLWLSVSPVPPALLGREGSGEFQVFIQKRLETSLSKAVLGLPSSVLTTWVTLDWE